jgi:hypothetical protein
MLLHGTCLLFHHSMLQPACACSLLTLAPVAGIKSGANLKNFNLVIGTQLEKSQRSIRYDHLCSALFFPNFFEDV